MINVIMDKEVTFDLMPGVFKSTLTNAKLFNKQTSKGKQDWIRLIWEVYCEGKENMDCRAGRNFLLSFKAGSELRNFLGSILGPEFFKQNSAKTIDLEKVLVGLTGLVTLSHFYGSDADRPFVVVESFEATLEGKD